jgi:hypothetical protein
MKHPTRWAAAAIVIVSLAGLTSAYPGWPEDAGLDVWHAPALGAEIDQCEQRRAELDALLQASRARLARKAEIVEGVVSGHVSLADAAAEFRALNAGNPEFIRLMRCKYPHCPAEELHVRNVIDLVDWHIERRAEHDRVMARLRAEFATMKQNADSQD